MTNILQIIKEELEQFGINHDTWFHESSLGSINESESDLAKSFIDIENKGHTYKKMVLVGLNQQILLMIKTEY